jgi:hypothetical protein
VSTAQADGPPAIYEYDKTDGKTKEKFSPIIKEFSSGPLLTEVGGSVMFFKVSVNVFLYWRHQSQNGYPRPSASNMPELRPPRPIS